MRVWCYLLLSCAIRGRLRLGGFVLGKPRGALAVWQFIKQGGNHEPFSHSDLCWGNNCGSGLNVGISVALPG